MADLGPPNRSSHDRRDIRPQIDRPEILPIGGERGDPPSGENALQGIAVLTRLGGKGRVLNRSDMVVSVGS